MRQIETGPTELKLEGEVVGLSAAEVFACWTTPELLTQFWPKVANVDPRVGGSYRFEWPTPGWFLHGHYTEFAPGSKLGFTWTWNFELDVYVPLQVEMTFDDTAVGCWTTIHHWPFEESDEGQKAGKDTAGGWIHFTDCLMQTRPCPANRPQA